MTKLSYRSLRRWKYQTTDNLSTQTDLLHIDVTNHDFIGLTKEGRMDLKRFYSWNGANCFPDFKWIMRGSLYHDAALQLIHEDKVLPLSYRKRADKLLRDMCKEDGAPFGMHHVVYIGVRLYSLIRYGM